MLMPSIAGFHSSMSQLQGPAMSPRSTAISLMEFEDGTFHCDMVFKQPGWYDDSGTTEAFN